MRAFFHKIMSKMACELSDSELCLPGSAWAVIPAVYFWHLGVETS